MNIMNLMDIINEYNEYNHYISHLPTPTKRGGNALPTPRACPSDARARNTPTPEIYIYNIDIYIFRM